MLCTGAECTGADWTGAECTGADWTGADWAGDDEAGDEEAGVEETGVPAACVGDELAAVVAVLCLGFLAGARSAGTAGAVARGVTEACCDDAVLGAASAPVAAAGADDFLTAAPMAKAPPSPITSATMSSAQRLRTSRPAGVAGIAATLLPDINELSI